MTRLPIQGRGLDAIIRDTIAEPFAPSVDTTQIGELKAQTEREKARVAELEKTVADKEALAEALKADIARLSEESRSLRKTLDTEIPQGDAREILIETLRKAADGFDKKGNLLDAFHLHRRILRLDPHNIPSLYEVAAIYYSAGILRQSVETLRLIVEIDPSQTRAKESLEAMEEERGGW